MGTISLGVDLAYIIVIGESGIFDTSYTLELVEVTNFRLLSFSVFSYLE